MFSLSGFGFFSKWCRLDIENQAMPAVHVNFNSATIRESLGETRRALISAEVDDSFADLSALLPERKHAQLNAVLAPDHLQQPFYQLSGFYIGQMNVAQLMLETFYILNRLCKVTAAEKIVFFRTMTILYQVYFKTSSPEKIKHIKHYNLPILVGASFALAYGLDDDEDCEKYNIWEVLPAQIGLEKAWELIGPMGEIWALLDYDLYVVEDIYECYVKHLYDEHNEQQRQLFSIYLSLLRINPLFLEFDDKQLLLMLDSCLFKSSELQVTFQHHRGFSMVKELIDTFAFSSMPFTYLYVSFHLEGRTGRNLIKYLTNGLSNIEYVLVNHSTPNIELMNSLDNHQPEDEMQDQCLWEMSP